MKSISNKSLSKNMIMNSILTVSNFLFPLITYSYVARILSPSGTGQVAFVDSILAYFGYLSSLGVPAYGRREVAKIRDDKKKLSKLAKELFVYIGVATVVTYVMMWIVVLSVPKLRTYLYLFLIMGSQIVLKMIGVEWLYEGLEEYSYITKRSLFFKTISIGLTFLLIRHEGDILWYGFVHVFTICASYICNFLNIRKFLDLKEVMQLRTVTSENLKGHLKPILILFSASIAITIYGNFDVSMLGFISTEHEVGLYNAALKIKGIVLALSTAVTAVFVPRMAYYYENKEYKRINELLSKSISVSMLTAFPIGIYVLLFSEQVLRFIGGADYIPAENTLRVLTICIFLLIATNLCGVQVLIPIGREKRYTQSVFVGLFINLILNAILIPAYGAAGAAIGTLVTEVWNVFWMATGCMDYIAEPLKRTQWIKYFIPMIVAGLIALSVILYLKDLPNICVLIITSAVYFFIYYFALFALKEQVILECIHILNLKLRIIKKHDL